MKRRQWLALGCAHCAAWPLLADAQNAGDTNWQTPPRFQRPDLASDEGGLWALMDREETRLRRSPFRLRDSSLQAYLQSVLARLAGDHLADMRIYAVRTPYFNASMAPNGMMQVWSGLLLRVENEAQLAAVLAHEIAHYLQRHSVERLRDAKARSAFASFMIALGPVGLIGSLAALASGFGFTRDQEREADRIGLLLMERAGYQPASAAQVWTNLLQELSATPENEVGSTPMFATHPAPAERSEWLRTAAADRPGELRVDEFRAVTQPWRLQWLDDDLQRNRPAESLALLQRLMVAQPEDPALLYFRGETRRRRQADGDLNLAFADLQAAAAHPQGPALALRSLGQLLQTQGQAAAAREAFENYLRRAPDAPDAELIRHLLKQGLSS